MNKASCIHVKEISRRNHCEIVQKALPVLALTLAVSASTLLSPGQASIAQAAGTEKTNQKYHFPHRRWHEHRIPLLIVT